MSASTIYNPNCDSLLRATLDSISANDSLKRFADSVIAVNNSLQKIISDNITTEALIKSQEFYSSQFSNFTMVVSVLAFLLTAICAILITINFRSTKGVKKKFKKLNNELVNDRKKQKEKSDILSRLISKRYFDIALENLKLDKFFEYFANMYLFCVCLMEITLNAHDTNNLHNSYRAFKEKCNKKNIKEEFNSFSTYYYRFITCLINLLKHCEITKQDVCFINVKSIYNGFRDLLTCGDFKLGLECELNISGYTLEETKEILELAKRYREELQPASP